MRNKQICALLLALCMMFMLVACGGQTEASAGASVSETVTEKETPQESDIPDAPKVEETIDTPEASESVAELEPEELTYTVEYPLETNVTLTMLSKLEQNMQTLIENFDEVYAMQVYQERTGVDIEFQMLGGSVFDEQLNLRISSGDLPDLIQSGMAGYGTKLMAAIDDEILVDIAPYLEEYAPDYYARVHADQSLVENLYNDDGSTSCFSGIAIPTVDAGMTIRGDWMDALGLQDPTTISELKEVLRAFKAAYDTPMTLLVDSDLSCGLEASFNTTQTGFDGLMMQLTSPNSGVVIAGFASEGYMEYLDFLHDLYAEGIINDDFTGISMLLGTTTTTIKSSKTGVWNGPNRTLDPADYDADDPAYAPRAIALPTTDDGESTHVKGPGSAVGRGSVYVTATCSDIEVACQFMNYAYTDEGITLCSFGVEGETFQWIDDEDVEYAGMMTADPDMADRDAEVLYLVSNWMPTVQTQAMFNLKNNVSQVRDAAVLWTETSGDDSMELPDGVTLNTEETDTVNRLAADILTLFSERAGTYVMGGITRDDMLATIEDAKDMGLTEITEIYQAAYDDYMAKH